MYEKDESNACMRTDTFTDAEGEIKLLKTFRTSLGTYLVCLYLSALILLSGVIKALLIILILYELRLR